MLTQGLAKDSTRKIRVAFGGFIASLIVPISIYYPESFITGTVGKVLFSVFIILCAFRFYSVFRLLKMLLLFYFTTFAIGGGLIAVHFMLQRPIGLSVQGVLTINNGYGDPVSWLFVVLGFPVSWWFTKTRMDKHAIEKIQYDQMYPITIQIDSKCYSTTGYIDSGNQLIDPISKKPVIIGDEQFVSKWFSMEDWELLKNAHENMDFDKIPNEWKKRIQIVPFQGVGGNREFMLAIKPDQLIIYYENEKITTNKLLIGIQFAELTKDQSYHCLLHPQIIKLAIAHTA